MGDTQIDLPIYCWRGSSDPYSEYDKLKQWKLDHFTSEVNVVDEFQGKN